MKWGQESSLFLQPFFFAWNSCVQFLMWSPKRHVLKVASSFNKFSIFSELSRFSTWVCHSKGEAKGRLRRQPQVFRIGEMLRGYNNRDINYRYHGNITVMALWYIMAYYGNMMIYYVNTMVYLCILLHIMVIKNMMVIWWYCHGIILAHTSPTVYIYVYIIVQNQNDSWFPYHGNSVTFYGMSWRIVVHCNIQLDMYNGMLYMYCTNIYV